VLAAEPDGAGWLVDIGARLGPLRRAKTVRMVRTDDSPDTVVFERQEHDGRQHSPWVLTARLDNDTDLTVHLHYGGSAWLPGLDRVLQQEIKRAPGRLHRHLAD
jgi:hypothetical protein